MNKNHDSKGWFAAGKGGSSTAKVRFGKSTASNEAKSLGRLQGRVASKNIRDFTAGKTTFREGYKSAGGSLFKPRSKK